MRNGLLGLVTSLLASGSLALGQPLPSPLPTRTVQAPAVEPIPAPRTTVKDAPTTPVPPLDNQDLGVPAEPIYLTAYDAIPPRGWVDVDYLFWWIKDGPLPAPLLTTGSTESGGILLEPGTTVLVGGKGIDFNYRSGARLSGGRWLDEERTTGIEGSFFFLGERSNDFSLSSNESGEPFLARPIQNARTDDETSILLAAPGRFQGGFAVTASSQLWGAELNLLGNLLREGQTGINLLAGFRYLDLDEQLTIGSQTIVQPGGVGAFLGQPVLAPNALAITDVFATRNQFYGGQLGARGTIRRGRVLVDVTGKVAFGATRQLVRISGSTQLISPEGLEAVANGGALALPTNIGRRKDGDVSVIPEGSIRVGYQLTERIRAHVGANFLWWDKVVRPGDQIDRRVNLTQLPSSFAFGTLTGVRQPAPLFLESNFWAIGLDFGLAFQF